MATYILFWNPAISSFTMEDFQTSFEGDGDVDNWSFYEHKDVERGDTFYMVRCGEGKTGIVMYGEILSKCFEDEDWSPKNRKHIFYASLDEDISINPETAEVMLTPEFLTEKLPDFNWFGGHSGRRLTDEYAKKLDEIWLDYIDSNPQMFAKGQARLRPYYNLILTPTMKSILDSRIGPECEICGYSYQKVFGDKITKQRNLENSLQEVVGNGLKRYIYRICCACHWADDDIIADTLRDKNL